MKQSPTQKTLQKYGLTEQDWKIRWLLQGEKCPVCKRSGDNILFVIDHEHVKGWKKMPPEKRRKFIRGIICTYCNQRRVGRGITTETAYNSYLYLKEYDERKSK
jgi:hypothetical protein